MTCSKCGSEMKSVDHTIQDNPGPLLSVIVCGVAGWDNRKVPIDAEREFNDWDFPMDVVLHGCPNCLHREVERKTFE